MAQAKYAERQRAVRVADAVNAVGGVPVTQNARELSTAWARGEISAGQMKAALLAAHEQLAGQCGAADDRRLAAPAPCADARRY